MNNWNKIFAKKGEIFGKKPSPILVKAIRTWKPKNKLALDIGAYTGRNSIYLANKKFKVTAIDSASEPLKQLKKHSIKTINQKIENYKWTKKYDIIVCLNVLQFISPKKVTKIIKQIKNNTNKKGLNIITVFLTKPFKTWKTFKHNELKKLYSDWKIKHYSEKTKQLATGGKVKTANIIATKP